MTPTDAQIATLERLARTQRNLHTDLTEQEREDLRQVSYWLRGSLPGADEPRWLTRKQEWWK